MAQTVMVVEDNASARDSLSAILRKHGYHVLAVENGLQALDRLNTGPLVDVILLDMLMPVVDGWDILERLRSGPGGAPPIVVTTGAGLSAEWAAAQGCAGFVP